MTRGAPASLRLPLLVSLASVAIFVGCDRRKSSTTPTSLPPAPAPIGRAEVVGTVRLRGTPPTLSRIDVSSVRECATRHPLGLPDESIVANDQGLLRNVIVYVKGPVYAGNGSPVETSIDQVGCRYVSHVIAMRVGQRLRIKSSDPFLHNVNGQSHDNLAFNFAQSGPGTRELDPFSQPEFFSIRCDVHPWMKAWVGVMANPWYAVTGEDGSFRLAKVPAGTYTLVAWQERLGELSREVSVPTEGTINADFDFK